MIKNNPLWELNLLLQKITGKHFHDTKHEEIKSPLKDKRREEQTQTDIYLENNKRKFP